MIPYGRQTIENDDIQSVIAALGDDFLTTGPKVQEFEHALCALTGAKYAVAVANGTAALHIASLALLKKGDKVLTTPNSFLATSNAILYAQAIPIFVDITENGLIDLDACEKILEKDPSIKALYGVHFSGLPLDQKKLSFLKNKYNIIILEDCAHSLGAFGAGACINSDASIFSFHPVKHITTGEGGGVTTNDENLYHQLLTLRSHGMEKRGDIAPWYYEMSSLGFNYRITDIQCALGISQLSKLSRFITRRHELVKNYEKALAPTIVHPLYPFDEKSSYHLFCVRVDFSSLAITKKELFIAMHEKGIILQLHYIPINKQPYYRSLGYGNELTPMMDRYYEEIFSLPLYPLLSDDEQKYVIQSLLELLK